MCYKPGSTFGKWLNGLLINNLMDFCQCCVVWMCFIYKWLKAFTHWERFLCAIKSSVILFFHTIFFVMSIFTHNVNILWWKSGFLGGERCWFFWAFAPRINTSTNHVVCGSADTSWCSQCSHNLNTAYVDPVPRGLITQWARSMCFQTVWKKNTTPTHARTHQEWQCVAI